MEPDSLTLERLGWNPLVEGGFRPFERDGFVPARVAVEHNHLYRVYSADGERLAESSGRLRHDAKGPEMLPAVGDWVAVTPVAGERKAIIHAVLPRRTCFSRKAAGDATRRQVVASNIDTVFLVSGLDDEFNLRRVERYLAAAKESGATPVIVLNKADLCDNIEEARALVSSLAPHVHGHVTSSLRNEGLEALAPYCQPGQTVVLIGSSGVGKSTIINRLLGADRQLTREVRQGDHRGRHATIHRELIPLATGGLLIDTPGMRELQLWDDGSGLEEAFADIEELAVACHFRDCRHEAEPHCAVRQAVDESRLAASRLNNYHRLQREREYLHRRQDQWAAMSQRRLWRSIHKLARDYRPRE